jgi:hypothetical protein
LASFEVAELRNSATSVDKSTKSTKSTRNCSSSLHSGDENSMASFSLMHRAHTADPATIFIHNGAPQALIGSQGGVGAMPQSAAGYFNKLIMFLRFSSSFQ